MAANTTALIKALRERVNKILTTYYEEAPSKDAVFPYAVINGVNIIDLAAGDLFLSRYMGRRETADRDRAARELMRHTP